MIGSIIGDIVGSIYEFHNIKTKDFSLFSDRSGYTDDSILTIATAKWILEGASKSDSGMYYYRYGANYPHPLGGDMVVASRNGYGKLKMEILNHIQVAVMVVQCVSDL